MEEKEMKMRKVPVLVLAFNRADHVAKAMESVREYQPERLYLACDGPRDNKEGEKEAVAATRKAMLDAVDWHCEVKTLFRDKNLGCAWAVYGAITWFFEQEEWGIIIEDDIILSQDFYKLCEVLLPYYEDDDRIMHINSQNYSYGPLESSEYRFGKAMYCWGWASWARAWKMMDMTMSGWPKYRKWKMLKYFGFFKSIVQIHYWNGDYKRVIAGTNTSWATIWNFAVVYNKGICISPCVNLSKNIGIDGGTHYTAHDEDPYRELKVGRLRWPLRLRKDVNYDSIQLKIDNKEFFRIRMIGLRKKIKRMIC